MLLLLWFLWWLHLLKAKMDAAKRIGARGPKQVNALLLTLPYGLILPPSSQTTAKASPCVKPPPKR